MHLSLFCILKHCMIITISDLTFNSLKVNSFVHVCFLIYLVVTFPQSSDPLLFGGSTLRNSFCVDVVAPELWVQHSSLAQCALM